MKNFFYLLFALILFSCKTQQKNQYNLTLDPKIEVIFQDSIAAGQTITQDNLEYFFDYISMADIEIQIKQNFAPNTSRKTAVDRYKDFLRKDVMDFSKADLAFIEGVLKEMYQLCNQVSSDIFPSQLILIKTHGKHYGNSVYYTRENSIVIPADALEQQNHNAFLSTMLHELSHIYTRYHPKKKKALYQLIGFEEIGTLGSLQMDNALEEILLLNPDGINFAQRIQLTKGEEKINAIPIITAKKKNYDPAMPDFFLYLDFNIYQVKAGKVLSDKNGKSTIQLAEFPDFFTQIKDNTQYIIHPDEIIADNFMHYFMSLRATPPDNNFSVEGTKLLEALKNTIAK